ncbi:discoidin domain-containing protein [Zhouia amylolytica]|nr:discoidin domain-containing protein [Zhouia amylolytica]
MKKVKTYFFMLMVALWGCSSPETESNNPDENVKDPETELPDNGQEPDLGNYISDYEHNLNVVYLVPSDIDPLDNYHERISGIMTFMQKWYKDEMTRYGINDKTFGLLKSEKDPSYVKVILVNGNHGQEYYPYEGGGGKAGEEIKEYFSENPGESSGAHSIVFLPSREGDNGWDAGGVPFYGIGKWCYALDYTNFDMKYWQDGSQQGNSLWIGGTIHELGHALNLPHNKHQATDNWTSMMSLGNHEFNDNPDGVHLTFASALILNNNQVMNKVGSMPFYEQTPSLNPISIRLFADAEKLYFRAKFETDIPVNGFIAYNDPKTSSSDADYNAVTWASRNIINGDSISLDMPLSGIDGDFRQYPFDLRLRFLHENGNFSVWNYSYEFVDGKPDIDVELKEVTTLSKDNWEIVQVSSEELNGEGSENGAAKYLIDGDSNTFWHSQWQGAQPGYPHNFTIDLGTVEVVKGFLFNQRSNKFNGRVKDIEIEISDDAVNWTKIQSGTVGSSTVETLDLNESQSFRYFKINILTGHDNGSGEDIFFTHLAEISAY